MSLTNWSTNQMMKWWWKNDQWMERADQQTNQINHWIKLTEITESNQSINGLNWIHSNSNSSWQRHSQGINVAPVQRKRISALNHWVDTQPNLCVEGLKPYRLGLSAYLWPGNGVQQASAGGRSSLGCPRRSWTQRSPSCSCWDPPSSGSCCQLGGRGRPNKGCH